MGSSEENISLAFYRYDHPVVTAIIEQLEKDILLSGGEFHAELLCYQDIEMLRAQFMNYVKTISKNDASLLINLLYRVDIPQQYFSYKDLSELILKRELIKVLMRINYSKK